MTHPFTNGRNESIAEQRAVALSRRNFLRGVGVSIALPVFPSLISCSGVAPESTKAGATSTKAPLRMAFMQIANGAQQEHWFPTEDFGLNYSMEPLEGVKHHLQVIAGLDHRNAMMGADGPGDHARANATFLTGARARKTGGSNIHIGISVDQVAAQKLGHLTRFPSLELSTDTDRYDGMCDNGYACAYQYNLSWSSAETPVTPEQNPRFVFERLFGAGDKGDRRKNLATRLTTEKSILDFVLEESRDVQRQLGSQDQRKFNEYLNAVREMERRLKATERFDEPPAPESPVIAGIPQNLSEHMQLMYDMLIVAFQTDSTRIGTILLAHDGSNRAFPEIGISGGHHDLTHNQATSRDIVKKVADIDRFYMTSFAKFLEKMSKTEDVDGNSLLHNSMIVYGGAIADGNLHNHENLPVILAGHGGGAFVTDRLLKVVHKPMSNLYVAMLNRFGVETEKFGDSTGRLDQVESQGRSSTLKNRTKNS